MSSSFVPDFIMAVRSTPQPMANHCISLDLLPLRKTFAYHAGSGEFKPSSLAEFTLPPPGSLDVPLQMLQEINFK